MNSPFENMQRWKCRCGTWNDSTHTECKKCGDPIQRYVALQYWNKLTPVEERFYKHTGPALIQETNQVNKRLSHIITLLAEILEKL